MHLLCIGQLIKLLFLFVAIWKTKFSCSNQVKCSKWMIICKCCLLCYVFFVMFYCHCLEIQHKNERNVAKWKHENFSKYYPVFLNYYCTVHELVHATKIVISQQLPISFQSVIDLSNWSIKLVIVSCDYRELNVFYRFHCFIRQF